MRYRLIGPSFPESNPGSIGTVWSSAFAPRVQAREKLRDQMRPLIHRRPKGILEHTINGRWHLVSLSVCPTAAVAALDGR